MTAPRACLGLQVRPPTLALLPAATLPGAGLLLSAVAHAGIICAVVMWLPKTLALPSMVATHPSIDMRHERDPEVLIFAALPPLDDAVASDSRPAHSEHPKRDFAGPREIVSLLPDATNNVQTIRQPTAVAPPMLANPVRVQSVVMLPPRAVPPPSFRASVVHFPQPAVRPAPIPAPARQASASHLP